MSRSVRCSKDQVLSKIKVLEEQLESLDHYLPETYQYLMMELDQQRLVLAEISVGEAFDLINEDCTKKGSFADSERRVDQDLRRTSEGARK